MANRFRSLTADEETALQIFAKANGRRWKSVLSDEYWYKARLFETAEFPNAGSILHCLRNDLGPSWLASYKLPK
jgi:hypothetical protein